MQPPRIPTDYIQGYEKARAIDPDLADNYVAHTLIGDPLADDMVKALLGMGTREGGQLVGLIIEGDAEALRDAPSEVQAFFEDANTPPDWAQYSAFSAGCRLFHRNSKLVLAGMVGGTLVEGFSTNIAKSFFISGRLRDQGVRRLKQNNRHMVEIFIPGGLARYGDGWKLSVRVRMVHAVLRHHLNNSPDWDHEAWGEPISAAHVGFAITAFSMRLLDHLRRLGAAFDKEERASFLQVWRYSGHLMGIPSTILFGDEADAMKVFRIGNMCEPKPSPESVSMANALVNSAPLIAGITDPEDRKKLSSYVYRVSRALIGHTLADQLMYPHTYNFGVLWWFRMQNRYDNIMGKLFKNRARNNNKMTAMLDVSIFDEGGINYSMPDHVYSEESRPW